MLPERSLTGLLILALSGMLTFCGDPPGVKGLEDRAGNDSLEWFDSMACEYRTRDTSLALSYARKAWALYRLSGDPVNWIRGNILMGNAWTERNFDSAYFYLEQALRLSDSVGEPSQRAAIFYELGSLNNQALDQHNAMLLFDSAFRTGLATGDLPDAVNALIMKGTVFEEINDYEAAIDAYQTAWTIASDAQLYKQMAGALANLGKLETIPDTAVKKLHKAVELCEKAGRCYAEIASIYVNIGYKTTDPEEAIAFYRKALEYTGRIFLPEVVMGACNNMAYSYLELNKPAEAVQCIRDHALPVALQENNIDWLATLYDSYSDILAKKGDFSEAFLYLKKANQALVMAEEKKAAGQLRLLAALQERKAKEEEIRKISGELAIQQSALVKTRLWLAITLLGFLLAIGAAMLIILRTRLKLQRQQVKSARLLLEREEGEKARISRELHDITGQLVLGITGEIHAMEGASEESRRELLDRIGALGQSIRRISHHMNRAMTEHFTFRELLEGLVTDTSRLSGMKINLEITGTLPEIPNETVLHLYRILQEMLTNVQKHAPDASVTIHVTAEGKAMTISYLDSGPGFDPGVSSSGGLGITSITERTRLLGGHCQLDTAPGKGVRWLITIPIKTNFAL